MLNEFFISFMIGLVIFATFFYVVAAISTRKLNNEYNNDDYETKTPKSVNINEIELYYFNGMSLEEASALVKKHNPELFI